ncbi:MAG: histidine phosphatase family protein [Candidatus Binatus sp.]|uniref:histidine phosphatase family protein n=1 Tax=Candidatus Binatus sp. TaxID=2811406 RepID=UPI00271D9521|nr:histidine phosphatase family protein [Candidatus Binatus sp.]MDO8434328.1 histidine phosphatase family protein [Candidatus Binatus sp.]
MKITSEHGARLFLVRHGETEGESSIRYHGRNDIALSDLGRAQMRAARIHLESVRERAPFSRIFSSPLMRASESARIIAGGSTALDIIDDFAEVHFGLFEGLTAGEISERFPEEFARWNLDRLAPGYTYPEGENRTAFVQRVERGVDRMLEIWTAHRAHAEDREPHDALVVAHRGVIRAIVRKLSGAQPTVELASIHILHFGDRWHPHALDIVEHLASTRHHSK